MSVKSFLKKKIFPAEANFYAKDIYMNLLLNNAFSRSAVSATIRNINPVKPGTWEFSGFSQNGEDGIIEYLLSGLQHSNKYFIEIGSGNGLENNTSYLAHVKKFAGIQVEGSAYTHNEALIIKPFLVESLNLFVNEITVQVIYEKALYKNPDVFSIDIDGMDYYITRHLFEKGLKPKIIVVEYNSAFGPERSNTIPYNPEFNMFHTDHPYLYYGVSISGWKNLFAKYGYQFITVETNGVNAFFINPEDFNENFMNNIQAIVFKENIHQLRLFRRDFEGQFEMIKNLPLLTIE
ncbi:MAG: hypothetical protein IPL97_13835 [Niastella sp.]|nr:hypothetical protein [Niastella sp.]